MTTPNDDHELPRMAATKDLCIQIHPHRADALDLPGVQARCGDIARDTALVRRFAVISGEEHIRYVNLMFEASNVQTLWNSLWRDVYQHERLGDAMRRASMAMCHGERGWDDYLLLHHYDPAQELDRFETS